jgi:hypothetical protein
MTSNKNLAIDTLFPKIKKLRDGGMSKQPSADYGNLFIKFL